MTWLFIVRSWITRNRRLLLAAGLGLLAIRGLLVLTLVTPLLWSQLIIPGGPGVAPDASAGPPAAGPVPWLIGPGLILEGLVGASLLLAGLSLLLNRPRPGLGMAYWGLLLSLAGLQPLIFYLNQFDLVVTTMTHIFVWWIVREQRRRLARPVAPGLSRPAAGRTD